MTYEVYLTDESDRLKSGLNINHLDYSLTRYMGSFDCRETMGRYMRSLDGCYGYESYIITWDDPMPNRSYIIDFIQQYFPDIFYSEDGYYVYGRINDFVMEEMSLALYLLVANVPHADETTLEDYKNRLINRYNRFGYYGNLLIAYALDLIQNDHKGWVFSGRDGINGVQTSIESFLFSAFTYKKQDMIDTYLDFAKRHDINVDNLPTYTCHGGYKNYIAHINGVK